MVLPNCANDKRARARTRMRNRNAMQGLSGRLSCHEEKSIAISYHEEKLIVLSDCNVALLHCEMVSQSSHVTAWHSRSYCPTHFWYISCFTFLCLTGCSLGDAARPLLDIVNLTPRRRALSSFARVCNRHSDSLAEIIMVDQKCRTKLIVLRQIVHTLFASIFIL